MGWGMEDRGRRTEDGRESRHFDKLSAGNRLWEKGSRISGIGAVSGNGRRNVER